MQRKVEELQQLKGEMTEQLKVERRYFFQSREAGRTELKRLREEEADRKRKLGGERGRFDGIAVKEIDLGFL